jgi:hypothetical protein
MNELFKQDDFRQQYALAKEIGDKRFGSECKHEQTKNGYCIQCLRKVVTMCPEGYENGLNCSCPFQWTGGEQ